MRLSQFLDFGIPVAGTFNNGAIQRSDEREGKGAGGRVVCGEEGGERW